MIENTGERIKRLREEVGLSQTELAGLLGKNQNTIKDIETGENKLTKLENVLRLMEIFDISFEYLFADSFLSINSLSDNDNEIKAELLNMDLSDLRLAKDIIEKFKSYKDQ